LFTAICRIDAVFLGRCNVASSFSFYTSNAENPIADQEVKQPNPIFQLMQSERTGAKDVGFRRKRPTIEPRSAKT
jgi:hypothetical protein